MQVASCPVFVRSFTFGTPIYTTTRNAAQGWKTLELWNTITHHRDTVGQELVQLLQPTLHLPSLQQDGVTSFDVVDDTKSRRQE